MTRAATPAGRVARAVLLFLLGAALFATAYCQAPLYYSNQNQYFLHGLAAAGRGTLDEDWLASTLDPTPLFSALVSLTARYLHPWVFHLYHSLLLGAYAAAMLGLFFRVAGPEAARRWPAFSALLITAHAALPRWLSYRLLGMDYPWYLQTGLAGQYVLGAMLQPSVFGVLLVVAIALFVHGRSWLAVLCAAGAATVHATYMLPACLLTLGFVTALVRERQVRQALALGTLALALLLPVMAHVLLTFGQTSPEAFAQAQDILVNLRIPHHARPDLWLDGTAVLQVAWVVLATALAQQSRLRVVLAVTSASALLLTLVQVATGSDTLALLFPWRVSAVLVPVATTVVLSRLVALPALPLAGPAARAASAILVSVLVVGGVWIMAGRRAFRGVDEELPMMDHVRRTRAPGDVYLLPVRVPDLAKTTRGSLSSDFKPPAEKKADVRIIPVDLQRFRLHAEAPILVDFKSIPYKDVEVIEWRDRLFLARDVQELIRQGKLSGALAELRRRGVTHLVQPAGRELAGPGIEKEYEDSLYHVYRLRAVPGGD